MEIPPEQPKEEEPWLQWYFRMLQNRAKSLHDPVELDGTATRHHTYVTGYGYVIDKP